MNDSEIQYSAEACNHSQTMARHGEQRITSSATIENDLCSTNPPCKPSHLLRAWRTYESNNFPTLDGLSLPFPFLFNCLRNRCSGRKRRDWCERKGDVLRDRWINVVVRCWGGDVGGGQLRYERLPRSGACGHERRRERMEMLSVECGREGVERPICQDGNDAMREPETLQCLQDVVQGIEVAEILRRYVLAQAQLFNREAVGPVECTDGVNSQEADLEIGIVLEVI